MSEEESLLLDKENTKNIVESNEHNLSSLEFPHPSTSTSKSGIHLSRLKEYKASPSIKSTSQEALCENLNKVLDKIKAETFNKGHLQNDSESDSVDTANSVELKKYEPLQASEKEIQENFHNYKRDDFEKDDNKPLIETIDSLPSTSAECKVYYKQFSQETVTDVEYFEDGHEIIVHRIEIEEGINTMNAPDCEIKDPNSAFKIVTEESNLEMTEDLTSENNEPWYAIRNVGPVDSMDEIRDKAEQAMSEYELRKRNRQEKVERLAKKIEEMHQRQVQAERSNRNAKYWKPMIIVCIIVGVCVVAALYFKGKQPSQNLD